MSLIANVQAAMGWRQTPRLRESIGVGLEPVRQFDFGGCGPPQSNNQGVSDQPLSLWSSLLFDQFDDEGRWTGALSARNVLTLPTDKATELCGPAGAIVLLHCRVVHGSVADYSSRTGVLVRGRESAHVHMESYSARLPPRWDQVGYRSIFTAQTATSRPAWID